MRYVYPFALFSLIVPALVFGAEYNIDPSHSSVSFKIRHLVSKTAGQFGNFSGKISYEPKKSETWMTEATIETASINTNNKKRDDHLKGPDFFDVKKYPTITFKSNKVTDVDASKAKLHGDLTMHGVTKPVVLDVEFTGEGTDPWGNKKLGFTGTTKVSRKEFGISWNKALDAGSVMLGDDVEIALEVEADQVKAGQTKDKQGNAVKK